VKEEDGQLCYKQMEWIDEWMNLPEVQAELGVQKGRSFRSTCFVTPGTSSIMANWPDSLSLSLNRLQYASQPGILLPR